MFAPSDFIVAQSLGEYGSLGGALATGISHLRFIVEDGIRNMDGKTLAAGAGIFCLMWLVAFRRR